MEVDDNRANGGVGGSPANLHRQSGCIAADTSGTVLELVDPKLPTASSEQG